MLTYFESPQHPEGDQWNDPNARYYYAAEETYVIGGCVDQLLTGECKYGPLGETIEILNYFYEADGVLKGSQFEGRNPDVIDLNALTGLHDLRKELLIKHQEYMKHLKIALATDV